jgi:hypothetical protein
MISFEKHSPKTLGMNLHLTTNIKSVASPAKVLNSLPVRDFLAECFGQYPELKFSGGDIVRSCDLLQNAFRGGKKLLLCGNGGSASDCGHIAGELPKCSRVHDR